MLRYIMLAILVYLFFAAMAVLILLNRYHLNQLELYLDQTHMAAIAGEITAPVSLEMEVIDLREARFFIILPRLAGMFFEDNSPLIKIIGAAKTDLEKPIERMIDSAALHQELYNIFNLLLFHTLLAAVIFGVITYGVIYYFLAQPLKRLTEHIDRFGENPEQENRSIITSTRKDSVSEAERALANMQTALKNLLRERARLARLGLAVNKINHDLRNILSNAQLLAERLTKSEHALERRTAQRLSSSLERGIALCAQYLNYGRPQKRPSNVERLALHALISEVGQEVQTQAPCKWHNEISEDVEIVSRSDDLFRILFNLGKNAMEAGADEIRISQEMAAHKIHIDVSDNGPGLSLRARANLFLPFIGSGGKGTGLGLPIAQDLARDLGGDLAVKLTHAQGTVFRLTLPHRQ